MQSRRTSALTRRLSDGSARTCVSFAAFGRALCALKTHRKSSLMSRCRLFCFAQDETTSSSSGTPKWFVPRPPSRSFVWMGRSADARQPITNLSRVTLSVGTGFRFHSHLPSSPSESLQPIQHSSQQPIQLQRDVWHARVFKDRLDSVMRL